VFSSRLPAVRGLWVALPVCLSVVALPLCLAIDELRRPLRRFRGRTYGAGIRPDAGLAWHPRFAGAFDEYRERKNFGDDAVPYGTPLGLVITGLYAVLDRHFSPSLDARVTFDAAADRIRTGTVATIGWSSRLTKGRIDGGYANFRLLCLRETPAAALPWRGIECLADLAPVRRRDSRGETFESRLEFRIAPDLPPSDLTAPQPTYWVLVATIDGLAEPYSEEFYVPVYPGDR
jgi:hypothetical protein